MAYIRLSIARPRRGDEQKLEDVMRKITKAVGESDGCLESYLLRTHDDTGEIARISIYKDEDSAEAAANDSHIMALRSEQHLLSESNHVERAFFTI